MRLIIQLLPLALLFIACPNKEDTCAPLGDTFIDVRQSDGPGGTLSLDLTTLDTLPATYFSQATLVRLATDQNGAPFNNLAENSSILQASPDSLRISLPVPQNSTAIAAGLAIRYPDRRDFVDCQHPGSGDQYVLFLRFDFSPDGQVAELSWVEDYRPGGF